jgi:DNA-binding MarR family transcriptional regulator
MIIKSKHRADFFQMNKSPIQDPGLSWDAKGLLVYLLSRPEDFEVRLRDLFTRSASRRVATQSALNELIAAGYVVKEQGENKRRTTRYIVYEDPALYCQNNIRRMKMKEFFGDNNVSKADILKKAKESLSRKTKEEIQKMIQPVEIEKLPVFMAALISAYVKNPIYGGMDIDTFLEYALGDNRAANNKSGSASGKA